MKPSPQFIIYFIGIALFGLFYGQVKAALGGGALFLFVAVAYALTLRLIGFLVARLLAQRTIE